MWWILAEDIYPKREGAGFLTTLYQENICDPDIFICPGTDDKNTPKDLLKITGKDKDKENFVSYAGRKNLVQRKYPGIYRVYGDVPRMTLMAADDLQAQPNHENGKLRILLFHLGDVLRWRSGDKIKYYGLESNEKALYDPLTN